MSTVNFNEIPFNEIFLKGYDCSGWEMSASEKLIFNSLLESIKPAISLEIGSRAGGSLQLLNHFSKKVFCVDIDPTIENRLGTKFPKTEFFIGDSSKTLKEIYSSLIGKNLFPNFIHIDGNHTAEGAYLDLLHTLEVKPPHKTFIIMHDTFNPEVREGMKRVDINRLPHVHYADFDFAPGVIHERPAVKDQMWGGFSFFILEPTPRSGDIIVNQFLNRMIDQVAKISSH